ncbi:hypothetical protein Dda_6910 [Drechslerella dactyloides]|uniref:Uncharacterized protein n=1 Tax=Drechslerella dactyloides TaxID=74499 RepID=A0AAD6IT12_DREDA|nr:hypothetical protein Dda_6910 [Drechslerella dactyloides]
MFKKPMYGLFGNSIKRRECLYHWRPQPETSDNNIDIKITNSKLNRLYDYLFGGCFPALEALPKPREIENRETKNKNRENKDRAHQDIKG